MKSITISQKRQITIPKQYFEEFGFEEEAECIPQADGILIRPKKSESYDFSTEILQDLIKEGYAGEALLSKFKETKEKVRPGIIRMIDEADNIAEGLGDYCTIEDIF